MPDATALTRLATRLASIAAAVVRWLPILLLATSVSSASAQSKLQWSPHPLQPKQEAAKAGPPQAVVQARSQPVASDSSQVAEKATTAARAPQVRRRPVVDREVAQAAYTSTEWVGEPAFAGVEGELAYPGEMGACDACASCGGEECTCYMPGAYWRGCGENGGYYPWCYSWRDRLWFRGEYLLWWTRGADLPPLVTTSPDEDGGGVLGRNTSILFGDTTVGSGARSGGRATLGHWFSPAQCTGIQASYLGLSEESETYFASSEGDPLLARPFSTSRPPSRTPSRSPSKTSSRGRSA